MGVQMEAIRNILDKVLEKICCILLAIMVVLIFWQVFTRYVLGHPSVFSEALAKYLFIWLIFFSMAYVFGKREHMAIEFFADKLSKKKRLILDNLNQVLIILFSSGVLIYGGIFTTIYQMQKIDATLQIPMGYIYMIVPISGLLVIFYCINNIRENLINAKEDE